MVSDTDGLDTAKRASARGRLTSIVHHRWRDMLDGVMVAPGEPKPRRGRPRKTAAERATQRADLIDKAMSAIRSGGADVSMDDLADRMGVSKPVIYDEFGGRVGLADAIAVVTAERIERDLLRSLTTVEALDIGVAVHRLIDSLITFIDTEEELYEFFVRAIRSDGRGLLGNGLVRVLRDRTAFLIGGFGSRVDADELAMLTDGVYGFLFAAIESWQSSGRLSREALVERLSQVIELGLQGLAILPQGTNTG